jgi:hypothetical protein
VVLVLVRPVPVLVVVLVVVSEIHRKSNSYLQSRDEHNRHFHRY